MTSATKKKSKETKEKIEYEEPDCSLNDVMLRGRVSDVAVEKTLPSGDKVVEFRLIVTRLELTGVDTLDIAAWSAKSRRSALSLKPDEWIEISGAIHRRFWKAPTGLASRWQVEAAEISRIQVRQSRIYIRIVKAVIMANDLFASLRTYLNKVSDGERTPAELANALNNWVKQSGDVLKSKIDEEVHNTVTRMGFIKREEFDELKAEFEELKKVHNRPVTKKSAAAPKKKPAAKKSTTQKKSSR